MWTSLASQHNRHRPGALGRHVAAALLALATAVTHAEPGVALRWYGVAAPVGSGADCGRLLAPGQKLALIALADDPRRAALLTDDGRLLPLARAAGSDEPPAEQATLRLVERPGQPPALTGRWPDADCRLDGAMRSAVTRLGNDGTAARRAFDALGLTWAPLPGAEREARQTAALFPRHRLLLGDGATEDRLAELNRHGELRRYRHLLFSTHGYPSPAHPLLSAIVLRQPGSAGYDGYLTAAELPLYDIDSELIVLSACETGVGEVRAGSGVMGLPLALMIAGNRNAVVTLWRVPDASAADFVVRLFRHLRSGQAPAPALARTKREMAQDRRYHDPLHWAGFVLYGAP